MNGQQVKKKKVKVIKIDPSKCTGCRMCEMACSISHSSPRYSSANPDRARIRLYARPLDNIYLPVLAGEYTPAECPGRLSYVINGQEYGECTFCRASCPSRNLFKEPGSGLPLKCDTCENDPTLEEPLCVQWCYHDALTYEEREEEVVEEIKLEEMEVALEALIEKYGLEKVVDGVARMASKG